MMPMKSSAYPPAPRSSLPVKAGSFQGAKLREIFKSFFGMVGQSLSGSKNDVDHRWEIDYKFPPLNAKFVFEHGIIKIRGTT